MRILTSLFFVVGLLADADVGSAQVVVGDTPPLVASTMAGERVEIPEGSVVLVDFWATWCEPCERSMPHYAEMYDRYADDGFVVLAVSIDERRRDIERFVAREELPFPIAWDSEQSLVALFAPNTMPTAYVVDRAGVVRELVNGFHEADVATLDELITRLLAEPAPDQECAPDADCAPYTECEPDAKHEPAAEDEPAAEREPDTEDEP